VRIWDPATGSAVGQPLTGHTRGVSAVAAFPGPDGHTLLATGGVDATVRIWDVIGRTCLAVLTLHVSITSLAAIMDRHLAVGTHAGVVVLDVSEVMLP
jgi:WD40 repeat protein